MPLIVVCDIYKWILGIKLQIVVHIPTCICIICQYILCFLINHCIILFIMSWILNSSTLSLQQAILKDHYGCCNSTFCLTNDYDDNIPNQVAGIGQNGVQQEPKQKHQTQCLLHFLIHASRLYSSVYIFSLCLIIFVHMFQKKIKLFYIFKIYLYILNYFFIISTYFVTLMMKHISFVMLMKVDSKVGLTGQDGLKNNLRIIENCFSKYYIFQTLHQLHICTYFCI